MMLFEIVLETIDKNLLAYNTQSYVFCLNGMCVCFENFYVCYVQSG